MIRKFNCWSYVEQKNKIGLSFNIQGENNPAPSWLRSLGFENGVVLSQVSGIEVSGSRVRQPQSPTRWSLMTGLNSLMACPAHFLCVNFYKHDSVINWYPHLRDKIGLTDFSLKSRFYCILVFENAFLSACGPYHRPKAIRNVRSKRLS